jgi:hypothetical protein
MIHTLSFVSEPDETLARTVLQLSLQAARVSNQKGNRTSYEEAGMTRVVIQPAGQKHIPNNWGA